MSRRPIGNRPMTVAERCRRYRRRLKARNAAPAPDPLLAFLTQHPDAVADGIYRRVPELTRGITMALKRRLVQNGSRPEWQSPIRATTGGAPLGWMRR